MSAFHDDIHRNSAYPVAVTQGRGRHVKVLVRVKGHEDCDICQGSGLDGADNNGDDLPCLCVSTGRPMVACDDRCGAFEDPSTPAEIKAAYEHWRYHGNLSGCSHGN